VEGGHVVVVEVHLSVEVVDHGGIPVC
jgi:hypothetical protein